MNILEKAFKNNKASKSKRETEIYKDIKSKLPKIINVFSDSLVKKITKPAVEIVREKTEKNIQEKWDLRKREREKLKIVREDVIKDALTGIYNQRAFQDYMQKYFSNRRQPEERRESDRIEEQKRRENNRRADNILEKKISALVYIDLDNFKIVNDTKGHLVGDRVLQEVVSIINQNLRSEDLFFRKGGDEFAIIFETSDHQSNSKFMEIINERMEKIRTKLEQAGLGVTASIGITAFLETAEATELKADELLYKSKNEGRNRINN